MEASSSITGMQPGCPWTDLYNAYPPNVKWCEAHLCSWVTNPANTWSNLVYIFLAWFIWQSAKKNNPSLKVFGPSLFIVGTSSLIYHASNNFFTQFLDFIGMYVFVCLMLSLNLWRMGVVNMSSFKKMYWGQVAFFGVLTILGRVVNFPIQALVLLIGIGITLTEIKLWKKNPQTKYGYFLGAIFSVLFAVSWSIMDVTRTFCDPHNHIIQGHAIWHLFSALGLWLAYKFYEQFKLD